MLPLLPLAIHVECGGGRNLSKRSTFCFNLSSSRSETSNSSGGGDLAAVIMPLEWQSASVSSQNSLTRLALMWFTLRLLMAKDHLCRAEWLRRQRQHREHHVSLDFELSAHESLHSIQLSRPWLCTMLWVASVVERFNLVSHSVTVDSSSFAVSLGDVGNPIIAKSVFWHFATSCDQNCKSDIESPMVHAVAREQIFYRQSGHLLCDHGTLRHHAHGSPNPCL